MALAAAMFITMGHENRTKNSPDRGTRNARCDECYQAQRGYVDDDIHLHLSRETVGRDRGGRKRIEQSLSYWRPDTSPFGLSAHGHRASLR